MIFLLGCQENKTAMFSMVFFFDIPKFVEFFVASDIYNNQQKESSPTPKTHRICRGASIVNHPSNGRLINAHTKGHGGHNDLKFI